MRVLYVTERFTGRGGGDVHLGAVMRRTARSGSVHLARAPGPAWDVGIEGSTVSTHRWLSASGLDGKALGAAARRDLEDLVERVAPDVIHAQNVLHPEVLTRLGALAPTVMTVQDHRWFCPGHGKLLPDGNLCADSMGTQVCARCFDDSAYATQVTACTGRRFESLRTVRAVVVLSALMARELIQLGLGSERLHVIPPWIEGATSPESGEIPAELREVGDAPWVLHAGRLVTSKGVLDLVDAMATVASRALLVLAGDGPARDQAVVRARERDVVCVAPGWLETPVLGAVRRGSRVLVMPGVWQEPFGLSGLEALAEGVPVIATDSGAIREWLGEGEAAGGWIVPRRDPGALGAALDEALRDGAEARRRGVQGQGLVRTRFSEAVLGARLDDLYARVARG